MSKIAVFTDVHVGARSASSIFCEHQIKFFTEQFIPYLEDHGITEIICCGDLFDVRKMTNHSILHEWKTRVFDLLRPYKFHLILGNHDVSFRNSLEVNSPSLFLNEYENIIIYDEPTEVILDETRVVFSPWICAQNETATLDLLKSTKAKIVFGHFEIAGFEMHRGQVATDGLSTSLFNKFDSVFSGHFHHRSTDGIINYIGNPYDLTWADYGDVRGFCVFDTSTLEHEFIDNPNKVHTKFYYCDESWRGANYIDGFDLTGLENTHVKVIVVNKSDLGQFDTFLNRLYNLKLADLKIVEDYEEMEAVFVDDDKIDLQDTISLIESYINSIEIDGSKEKLNALVKGMYLEAMQL